MSELAIKVEGLSKKYQLVKNNSVEPNNKLRHSLQQSFKRKLGHQKDSFWGLKDVSFKVKKGEVFGIVGANGAGKSTLLKILSGITTPTGGFAEVRGRVTSLLEVGTGFHPELTGRDNIFMNGSVLGMKKEDIKRKFNDIVAFSEIGKFIDTPVKHYSSGMQVRLAFAVAIHLEAEILIIDEVLSVGDFAFQQKSMKAIKSMLQNDTTVIMVSHNIESIRSLCDTVMILDEGKVESCGPVQQQTSLYINRMRKKEAIPSFISWEVEIAPENEVIQISTVGIKGKNKNFGEKIYCEDELEIQIEFIVKEKAKCVDVAFRIKDLDGYLLFGVLSDRKLNEEMLGKYQVSCSLPAHIFNQGQFLIDVRFLRQKSQGRFFHVDNVIALYVEGPKNAKNSHLPAYPGPFKLRADWTLTTKDIDDL